MPIVVPYWTGSDPSGGNARLATIIDGVGGRLTVPAALFCCDAGAPSAAVADSFDKSEVPSNSICYGGRAGKIDGWLMTVNL